MLLVSAYKDMFYFVDCQIFSIQMMNDFAISMNFHKTKIPQTECRRD